MLPPVIITELEIDNKEIQTGNKLDCIDNTLDEPQLVLSQKILEDNVTSPFIIYISKQKANINLLNKL